MKNLFKTFFFFLILLFPHTYLLAKKTQITLQLSWLHQFEYAGYYAAKEKGYYDNIGLDVIIKEMNYLRKDSVIDDVLAGKINFAISYSSIIERYLNGDDLVFIANFLKHSPLVLVSQEGIRLPSDIRGKRFMGGSDALKNTAFHLMLKQFGISKDDFIDVPQTFSINDFIDKKVDVTSIFLTNQVYKLNKAGAKYNIINPENYGAEFYTNNLFTSKAQYLKYPNIVKAFKQATIKGWKYALENKEELVDIILKKYNSQNKTKEELLFEANQIENLVLESVYPLGSINLNRVIRIADTYIQMGIVKKHSRKNKLKEFVLEPVTNNPILTKAQKKYLEKKKELTLCIDPNWMPFEEIDKKGRHIGLSSEYFDIFRKELGFPITLVKTESWTQTLDYLITRRCDILSLGMKTKDREEYLNFSAPVISTPLVLATKPDIPFIDNISNLEGRKIGIVKDYSFEKTLKRKYPFLDFVSVKSVDDGLLKVINEELFGFVGALPIAAYKFQESYLGQLKIAAKFDEKLVLSMGFRNDEPELSKIFSSLLSQITPKTKDYIYNKYVAISYESRKDYSLVWYSVFFFITIIAIFIYWNRKLRLQKEQTEKLLYELKFTEKLLEEKNEKLEKLYITDKLTNIYNRQKLDTELEKEIYRSTRTGYKFSLILVDIDHFKEVNDEYGHQIGDSVLIGFAKILGRGLRRMDILGRWGGEEFLIICPHTDEKGIQVKAEYIRKTIEKEIFPYIGKKTASLGVTTFKHADTEETILNRADKALYEAKNQGRNKSVFLI
ncbi:histidine kinase [Arcobacter sp. CECT 8989]|uniref:diguanylate cyclase n=1 Tax=Arcobacter sp. CECT 8989 TaxID=2044509 RepID=UPI00100B7E84|nr:diguanylate cyclase [Arcobacter sp. CECT 8989]RXK03921.1 histidine kinase [Arcobacter sp. CECT 8989]